MTTHGTPPAEVEIDTALLRKLLQEQLPELAEQPLQLLDTGWDNVSFRLGSHRVVRMPRRASAVPLIENEQKWLPLLAPRLPIDVPAPLAVGRPGPGYPWPFSVLPWLPGRTADLDPPAADQAERFAEFLHALHQPAPADAPSNAYRGVPLAERAAATEERMVRLRGETNALTPEVEAAWRTGLDAAPAREARWLHGDLHARNVLVDEGNFSAVIDWGDITVGDGATDLAAVWMLFDDARARQRVREAYTEARGAKPLVATWQRALGWAVFFGVVLLDSGRIDDRRHAAMGEATLRRITEDANAIV
jgi:aminoglycoside phosphotransferase (APT) family kinase protein